jgi:hypothetical protein
MLTRSISLMLPLCLLIASPDSPLWYPGFRGGNEEDPGYQRGTKEENPGTICISSHRFREPVTCFGGGRHIFERTGPGTAYICPYRSPQRGFPLRAAGKSEPGNPLLYSGW